MRLLTSYRLRLAVSTILIVVSVYITGVSAISITALLLSVAIARLSATTLVLLFVYVYVSEIVFTLMTGISSSSVMTGDSFGLLAVRTIPLAVLIASLIGGEVQALNNEPIYTVKRIPLRPGFYHHSIFGEILTLSPYIAVTKYGDRVGMWGLNSHRSASYETGVFIGKQFVVCPMSMPYEAIEILEGILGTIYTMFNGDVLFVTRNRNTITTPILYNYGVMMDGNLILSFTLLENGVIIGRTLYESGYITPDDILKHIKVRDILQ